MLLSVLLLHLSLAYLSNGGCVQFGACCSGRNFSCKSIETAPSHASRSLQSKDFRRLKPRKALNQEKFKSTTKKHQMIEPHWRALHERDGGNKGFSTVMFEPESAIPFHETPLKDGRGPLVNFGGGNGSDFGGTRADSAALWSHRDDPLLVVMDNGAWKHEIRYEIVDDDKVNDGVEVVDRESWNVRDKVCYCDERCRTFLDCCSDYKEACPRYHCKVSAWSKWTECLSGRRSFYGVTKRTRRVLIQPRNGGRKCPALVEKRACPIREDKIAQLLPYELGRARTYSKHDRYVYNMADHLHEQDDNKNYCAIFESQWVNVKCKVSDSRHTFRKGAKICVECQRTARQPHRDRCVGEGKRNSLSLWALLGQKTCLGQWINLRSKRSCSCKRDFVKLNRFIFV